MKLCGNSAYIYLFNGLLILILLLQYRFILVKDTPNVPPTSYHTALTVLGLPTDTQRLIR